jgi:hypothetical protein
MGFEEIITYTLESENGASLRVRLALRGLCDGGNWNVLSRPRKDSTNTAQKLMYYKNLE